MSISLNTNQGCFSPLIPAAHASSPLEIKTQCTFAQALASWLDLNQEADRNKEIKRYRIIEIYENGSVSYQVQENPNKSQQILTSEQLLELTNQEVTGPLANIKKVQLAIKRLGKNIFNKYGSTDPHYIRAMNVWERIKDFKSFVPVAVKEVDLVLSKEDASISTPTSLQSKNFREALSSWKDQTVAGLKHGKNYQIVEISDGFTICYEVREMSLLPQLNGRESEKILTDPQIFELADQFIATSTDDMKKIHQALERIGKNISKNYGSQSPQCIQAFQIWNRIKSIPSASVEGELASPERLVFIPNHIQEELNSNFADACHEGRLNDAEDLLKQGANINMIDSQYKCSTLHLACIRGNSNLVRFLLKNGVDQTQKDTFGATPYTVAVGKGYKNCYEQLTCDPYSKEYLHRKSIAHVFSIPGSSRINNSSINLEGSFPTIMNSLVAKNLESFPPNEALLSEANKRLMIEAFQEDSDGTKTGSQVLSDYRNGKPVLISTGYYAHSIRVLLHKGKMYVCDRGHTPTIMAFRIDESKLDKNLINRLIQMKTSSNREDFMNFFQTTLQEQVGSKEPLSKEDLAMFNTIANHEPKLQKVGNCAFAAAKGARFCLSLVLEMEASPNKDPIELEAIAQKVRRTERQLAIHDKLSQYEHYLEHTIAPTNPMDSEAVKLLQTAEKLLTQRIVSNHTKGNLCPANLEHAQRVGILTN